MTFTVNSTTVSTLATLFITILTGLEGFNWVSLMSPEMALQVVSYIGLAKLALYGWNTFTAKQEAAAIEAAYQRSLELAKAQQQIKE